MAQFLRVREATPQGTLRRVNVQSIAEYRPGTKKEQVKPGEDVSLIIDREGRHLFVQHSAEAIDKAIEKPGAVVDVA
jgi:hypothetical protein